MSTIIHLLLQEVHVKTNLERQPVFYINVHVHVQWTIFYMYMYNSTSAVQRDPLQPFCMGK